MDADPILRFDVRRDGTTLVVGIAGELDISNIEQLRDAVAAELAPAPERLVIEAAELRFADSSGIALWVRWAAVAGRIELRDPPGLLSTVIRSMGLGALLGVEG